MKKGMVAGKIVLLVFFMIAFVLYLIGCATSEMQAWQKARQADNFSAYSEYIGSYPRGQHVREAREKIARNYLLSDAEIDTVARLQKESPAEAKKIEYIDKLIFTGANCLDLNAIWIDLVKGKRIYDMLKSYDSQALADSMTRVVLIQIDRRKVLFLIVKLGIPGTERTLNNLLMRYGDKSMAEDYLNCGSAQLREGGEAWARAKGFRIMTGPGSHRVGWGSF